MRMRILAFSLLAASFAAECIAEDDSNAQSLHDEHCVSCHGSELYTREERKVNSLAALEKQVQWCETNLGLRWFEEDVSRVTNFLNDRYYHFTP